MTYTLTNIQRSSNKIGQFLPRVPGRLLLKGRVRTEVQIRYKEDGPWGPRSLAHLSQLPMKSFVKQRNSTREIRNLHNARHNEKEQYDTELKMQQEVVGIKEKSTCYPMGPPVPIPNPAFRIPVANTWLTPGKAAEAILWRI